MAWWLPNKCKPGLLRKHEENTKDETIDLGHVAVPLSECSVASPTFYYFRHGLPVVRQHVTMIEPGSGEASQYLIITRFTGQIKLHPIIEH